MKLSGQSSMPLGQHFLLLRTGCGEAASRVLSALVFATVCRVRLGSRRRFCGVFFPSKYFVGLEAVSSRNDQIITAAFQTRG